MSEQRSNYNLDGYLDPAKVMGREPKPGATCTCSAATLIRGGHSGWQTFDHEPTCPLVEPKSGPDTK